MATPSPKIWLRRALRAPSLHFAAIGSILFLGSSLFTGKEKAAERPRIEITALQLAEAEKKFAAEAGRPASVTEKAAVREHVIDEAILFEYALSLGLHQAEVPTRRLASIASFVSRPGEKEPTPEALAQRAVELGLHQGDFVTRRVLVDAAARLIRAAARLAEPSDEELGRFLTENSERFRGDATTRISHLLLSATRRAHPESDAAALLSRLQRERLSPEMAATLADSGPVPPQLPLLTKRALERRFDRDFAASLETLPEGVWSGPIESRYGAHLVFVHERRPGQVPTLEEARQKILASWHEAAANRWLTERLRQLREDYDIVLESEATS